ncbi:MAG: cyclic nucleotide-binding domain-containing protein [Cyanobacteria bacterium P01_D01_bin.105]
MTMLLAVSIGSISVIAYEGYRSGRTAILNSVEERLLSLRSAQATQLEELAPKATLGHFGRNESVICQGQNDVKVHFVLAGSAIATFTNEQGHSHTIDEISRGDFFGYSALLARAPSPMTVTATADLEVLVMEVDAVQKMLNRTPRFAQQVSAVIESRQQRLKQLQRKQNKNGSLLSSS